MGSLPSPQSSGPLKRNFPKAVFHLFLYLFYDIFGNPGIMLAELGNLIHEVLCISEENSALPVSLSLTS